MEQIKGKSSALPFELAICGVTELSTLMAQFSPSHIISISDPGMERLEFPKSLTVLRLAFFDAHTMSGMVGTMLAARDRSEYPCIDHAQAILEFGRQLPSGSRVLVHCWAGISRSTAAAYLLICQHMRGDEHSTFELLKAIRPKAQPNRLIVKFGDQLLGAERRMLRCVDR